MKKSIAFLLSLVMVLSMSVTAFADTSITAGSDGNPSQSTGATTVTYTVQPAYTVTIPSSVALDGAAVEVKAEGVKVKKGSQVVVKLTGTSGTDNAFQVKTAEGAELTYTVKNGGTDVNIGEAVLTVNPDSAADGNGASDSTSLSFALSDTIQYAGNYQGTVTFTVSVEAVSSPN